jgi:hypothetical protein
MDLLTTTEYYPVGQNMEQDEVTWIRRDGTGLSGTTYFGHSLILGADTASAVWKIRRKVVTGTSVVITYYRFC